MRTYKSGSKWAVWRWTTLPAAIKVDYIQRLHVLKTPWFAICLHRIVAPDPEPYLHDHPVSFFSIFLRGYYCEERGAPPSYVRHYCRRGFNLIRTRDRHRITNVSTGGCLTLAFMGPVRQRWGFFVQGNKVDWKDYYNDRQQYVRGDEGGTATVPGATAD